MQRGGDATGLRGVGLGALDGFDGAHNPWLNKTPASVPSVLACGRGSEEEGQTGRSGVDSSLPEWVTIGHCKYSIVSAPAGPTPWR